MEKRQQRGLFTVPGLLLAFCSHGIPLLLKGQVFSRIVDMPAGRGNVILTFTLTSTRHSADIPPYTFASDVQVMVIKKQALGISVV